MNYPDNFETPAFPAGTRIATSRAAAIGVSLVFLLILFLCGMLIWSARSARVHPFLVAANENPNEWRIVGHDHGRRTISATRALQESLISKFIQRRFFISDNMAENTGLWTACETADCTTIGNTATGAVCDLFCAGGEELFTDFVNTVVPDYTARAQMGERWIVDSETIRISPSGQTSENGGAWRVRFSVVSNVEPPIEISAYVKIARNIKAFPATMGFYIVDFNAYRMN